MKKIALCLALNLMFVIGTTSCAPVISALPTVIAYTQSGILVLDTIKGFVDKYFRNHVNTALEAKIYVAINKTQVALHAALATAEGTKNLTQNDIDLAFTDFKQAYVELMVLVGPIGINPKGTKLVNEADGSLSVPLPLAFVPRSN